MSKKICYIKKIIVLAIIFLMLVIISGVRGVYALEDVDNYTPKYKEYLQLTEEEKAKVKVIPEKYGTALENVDKQNQSKAKASLKGSKSKANLPKKYNLAEHYNILVENQGQEGNCWIFASLKTLETYLQIHGYGTYNFSENHVNYIESNLFPEFNKYRDINTGGTFFEFQKYVDEKLGPVPDEDFPYFEEGTTKWRSYPVSEYSKFLDITPSCYVGEYAEFPYVNKVYGNYTDEQLEQFRNEVKQHIMENGAVTTSIIAPSYYNGIFYNPETYAAYFNDNEYEGLSEHAHLVAIIGWDDEFSKDNFVEGNKPKKDGAYIVVNSWGTEFGDNGIYYISYEDIYVEDTIRGIKEAVLDVSEFKNTKTFTFKDPNLYQALKKALNKKVVSCDDNTKTITILAGALNQITQLDLSNSNITDLTGLENFKNLSLVNLSNNNISSIAPLVSLHELIDIDLSYNKIKVVPPEINSSKIESLNLSFNQIEDFSNLAKAQSINYLYLAGTPVKEDDFVYLKNLKISNLDLSNTNIKNCSALKGLNSNLPPNVYDEYGLTCLYLNNTNVLCETLPDDVRSLYLSHNNIDDEKIKKLPNFSVLEALDVSYTNIQDVKKLPLDQIKVLNISGNKNLINIDSLKNVRMLYYEDADISDVSIFNGFNTEQLLLKNNKIKDYSSLLENEVLNEIDLSYNEINDMYFGEKYITLEGNSIMPMPYSIPNNVISVKKQNYIETLYYEVGRENLFSNVATILKGFELEGIRTQISNATIDYNSSTLQVQDINKDVVISILNGRFEGSTITYKIEQIDTTNMEYLDTDTTGLKDTYIEGESVDFSKIKVYGYFDNDTKLELKDCNITGGTNLLPGENVITITRGDFITDIYVYAIEKDKIHTFSFNNKEIYDATLERIKDLENERAKFPGVYPREKVLVQKNDENLTIQILKEDISEINFLSIKSDEDIPLDDIKQFPNLYGIELDGKKFSNINVLNEIAKEVNQSQENEGMPKLFQLIIKNNETIEKIEDDIVFNLVTENSKICNFNNLSNLMALEYKGNNLVEITEILDELQSVNVEITLNIEDLQKDENGNIILPEIFKTLKANGLDIEATLYDQIRELKYLFPFRKKSLDVIENNGNLIINYEQLKEYNYDGNKHYIEINVIDTNERYPNFKYKCNIKYKIFKTIELENNEPIEIEENTVPDLSNLIVYKLYSNNERERTIDFEYSKEAVKMGINEIEISYSEDGIISKVKLPIKVVKHVHEWGEWKTIKEPTETEEGEKERVCLKDEKHKEYGKIDKLPSNTENPENPENTDNTEDVADSKQETISQDTQEKIPENVIPCGGEINTDENKATNEDVSENKNINESPKTSDGINVCLVMLLFWSNILVCLYRKKK